MKLEKLLTDITLTPLVPKESGGTIKILKASAVTDGVIDESLLDCGSFKGNKDITEYFLKKGDLLFQAKGNKFEALYIDRDYENLVTSQIYFNLHVDKKKVEPEYLCWYLNSRLAKNHFDANSSGSVVKAINKAVLLNLDVALPESLEKQRHIAELVREFDGEKKNTQRYLEQKELLINEKIISLLVQDGADE
ncbi:MAG: restriction endonuclease subunit S [Calditrichaeota bacterium]|nr:restriction endonuclease subunit S [Spirochaetales bacterium]RQW02329.1 MAG: restriction endonuclease subunit S [Calditrichota bacterium]